MDRLVGWFFCIVKKCHIWCALTLYFLHIVSRFSRNVSSLGWSISIAGPLLSSTVHLSLYSRDPMLKGLFLLDVSICVHTYWGNNSQHPQSPLQLEGMNRIGCCLVL